MAAFHFELVSPEKLLFSGDVDAVVVPGVEGQLTVLAAHAPLMTTLKPGVVDVVVGAGAGRKIFVRGGFADVSEKGLTILAEQALPLEELDAAALAQQIRNAEEDVADAALDEARRLAAEKLDQLRELKAALAI